MQRTLKRKSTCLVALVTTGIILLYVFNNYRIPKLSKHMVGKLSDTSPVQTRITVAERTNDIHEKEVVCLVTNPLLNEDELELRSDFIASGQYCVGGNKTLKVNINFNIERSVTFGPYLQNSNTQLKKAEDLIMTNDVKDGIPKRFHFIWSGAIIPSVFVGNLKRFRMLHPNWEINFWTIAHGRTVVQKLEPHILAAYNGYQSDTFRADALRYVLLYHYGGAYLDIDINPKIPFDNLTMLDDCLVGAEPFEHAFFGPKIRSVLSNAILFCKQKHGFFRYLIDQLPSHTRASNIVNKAGPGFLSRMFNSFISLQFHEYRSIKNLEMIKISILRHEYFEMLIQNFTLPQIKKSCNPIMSKVEYFMTHCLTKESDSINCTYLIRKESRENALFDVCVEWASHGKEKRDITDSIVYAHHAHYATRERLGSLKYVQENNISRILPNVIVHL